MNKAKISRNTKNDSESNKKTDEMLFSTIIQGPNSGARSGHSQQIAVRIIERAYCAYRDKQMFRLLKHAVCAAVNLDLNTITITETSNKYTQMLKKEHSLTKEIIKKIAPLESNLLNDPIFKVKIKFRFSGPEYPPFIVFKIFSQTHDSRSSKYINGKNMIKSTSPAAQEACSQMGSRKYYDLMIFDSLQQQTRGKIADPESIVCLRDFMQYSSVIDDMPAYMGGRSNSWRRLNLTDLPRYTVFYDVLNFALTKKVSTKLAKDMPILLKPPVNPDIQLEHIRIISKIDSPSETATSYSQQSSTYLNQSSTYKSSMSSSSRRRSKNALSKVLKMKKAYTEATMPRSETLNTDMDAQLGHSITSEPVNENFKLPDDLNDEFEREVKNLYMWTQNLSVNDDTYLSSPRIGSAL